MLETLIFALALNITGLTVAYFFKTDKLTDISYSLTFAGIALFGVFRNDMDQVKWLMAALVFAWAARLGGYLLYRIHVMGRDKRFDEMRKSYIRFGRFWVLQAVTAWVVMLPTSFVLRSSGELEPIGLLYIGALIAIFGMSYEGIADLQKFNFIQNKKNKGKWIDTGVWKNTRHPNYFGEIVMWLGVYISASPYLVDNQVWIAMISPLLIAFLLIFVSGIPLLEKSAEKRWGKDKAYQEYRDRTSILIPLPRGK